MSWTKLPKGEFTGIHWAQPGATAGFDPYLVWAEAERMLRRDPTELRAKLPGDGPRKNITSPLDPPMMGRSIYHGRGDRHEHAIQAGCGQEHQ